MTNAVFKEKRTIRIQKTEMEFNNTAIRTNVFHLALRIAFMSSVLAVGSPLATAAAGEEEAPTATPAIGGFAGDASSPATFDFGMIDSISFPATGSRPRDFGVDPSLKKTAESSEQFAWSAYRALEVPHGTNVFFSPYSIMNALGMLVLGSDGTTKTQLLHLLGADPSSGGGNLHRGLGLENAKLRAENSTVFAVANKFFVDSSGTSNINREYLAKLVEFYASSMQAVNFSSNPAEARNIVNNWVSENTFGKIRDILPANLDPQTQLILANAIYFKGKWEEQFNAELTSHGDFQTSVSGATVGVPFMYLNKKLYYANDDFLGVETLILPYLGSRYAMHIILPARAQTLAAVESAMNYLHLNKLDRSARLSQVVLKMPKFSMNQRLSLRDLMMRMNATDVFNPLKNDFSEIFLNTRPGFFVDDVIHEANVEVNEEGTVASAATSIIGTRVATADTKFVIVDRPFLFYIADESNGFVLFWGRVDNPSVQ